MSSTTTFCLYELSLHQDIQDRVRQETDVVLQKHDGKLTYEGILEMEYLDKFFQVKQSFKRILRNRTYILEYCNVTSTSVNNSHKFANKI